MEFHRTFCLPGDADLHGALYSAFGWGFNTKAGKEWVQVMLLHAPKCRFREMGGFLKWWVSPTTIDLFSY